MIKKPFIVLPILGSIAITCCLIIVNCKNTSLEAIYTKPLYRYAFLLFAFSLILFIIILNKIKTFYSPSFIFLLMLLAPPIIGPIGYKVFTELYGHELNLDRYFDFATFIWAVGTTSFFIGMFCSHFLLPLPKPKWLVLWDTKRAGFLMCMTLGLSIAFTVIALYRIGYIPVLHQNIDSERGSYEAIVGSKILKLSTLAIISGIMSWMLVFLTHKKIFYMATTFISCLLLTWSGYRTSSVFLIGFALLYFFKYKVNEELLH